MNDNITHTEISLEMTAKNGEQPSPEVIVAEVADVSAIPSEKLGNYPLFSGMSFPLTANKLAQIIMIHGNPYDRQCFGYFFHRMLVQECRWLIPVPIDSIDKNGLLRMIQTYEGNRERFPCIDGGILRNIYNRAGIGGDDENF